MWSYFKGGTLGVSWWYMMVCTQGPYLCYYITGPQEGERDSALRTGRETFVPLQEKSDLSKQTNIQVVFFFLNFLFPLWIQMFNDVIMGGFTISFRASRASMSPIFAAAHASGGVRASRMAANSCGRDQIFRDSTSRSNPGVWKKSALFLWSKKESFGSLTSLQLTLRDLAMTWMNRLSLRHRLVPAKSKLISPRRFWAISCTQKQTYWQELLARTHKRNLGIKN